ncbi:MAG: alpha/beta fold hydrolase, partial [Campylobacterota bacterium]|nr:alpha/beta fold hydrolase [Campylobacterota bacterium]
TLTILAIAFYQLQYFIMFSPTYHREEKLDEEFEELVVHTDDGVELEGIVYEPISLYRKLYSVDSTILFFAGRSHDSVGLIKKLSLSFPHTRIVTFNYRSYGRSEGKITEQNILNDADKIAKLVQKNYGDFYLLGFSLGSSVASHVASKNKVLGLFLIGAFDSVTLLAKEKYGVCLSWILRYNFNNIETFKRIDADTCMFVSKDDDITYIKNARNLKKHIKNLSYYIELEDVAHKELLWNNEVVSEINKIIHKE